MGKVAPAKRSDNYASQAMRKRGETGIHHTYNLGFDCNTIAILLFKNKIHKTWDGGIYIPEGEAIPENMKEIAEQIHRSQSIKADGRLHRFCARERKKRLAAQKADSSRVEKSRPRRSLRRRKAAARAGGSQVRREASGASRTPQQSSPAGDGLPVTQEAAPGGGLDAGNATADPYDVPPSPGAASVPLERRTRRAVRKPVRAVETGEAVAQPADSTPAPELPDQQHLDQDTLAGMPSMTGSHLAAPSEQIMLDNLWNPLDVIPNFDYAPTGGFGGSFGGSDGGVQYPASALSCHDRGTITQPEDPPTPVDQETSIQDLQEPAPRTPPHVQQEEISVVNDTGARGPPAQPKRRAARPLFRFNPGVFARAFQKNLSSSDWGLCHQATPMCSSSFHSAQPNNSFPIMAVM